MKSTVSSRVKSSYPHSGRWTTSNLGRNLTSSNSTPSDNWLVWRTALPNEGVVDWLLACPEKGFFVPIESESIDVPRDI